MGSVVMQTRPRRAKQSWYLLSMAFTLVVLFLICILLGLFIHTMTYQYETARAYLLSHDCIMDTSWRELPKKLYADSSMASEMWWAKFFLFFCSIKLIVGMCVTGYVFSKLGKLPNDAHLRM